MNPRDASVGASGIPPSFQYPKGHPVGLATNVKKLGPSGQPDGPRGENHRAARCHFVTLNGIDGMRPVHSPPQKKE